jgi:hypothetical protein
VLKEPGDTVEIGEVIAILEEQAVEGTEQVNSPVYSTDRLVT